MGRCVFGVLIASLLGWVRLEGAGLEGGAVRISVRDPRYFETADGRSYVPIGLNLIAPDGALGPGRENGLRRMDDWLGKLSANGGNFARIWLSHAFWDVEHERSGVFDEDRAGRIEALLELGRRHGIRLKLTLEHFREISTEPRQRWANKWLHHVSQGGTATNMTDFFGGTASRAQFRLKLDWFASRFRDHPAVFGWELWNEINAVRGEGYLGWTEAMLAELRRRFPGRLVMQSLGSFDSDWSREDYWRLTRMPGNDVVQVHRYLDLGAGYAICAGPVDVLVADAVGTLVAWQPGRPVLLAEGGAVEPGHTGPFKYYARDRAGIILHDVLFGAFFAGAAGPGQIWHWSEYVDRNDLWHHFGRFAELIRGLDVAGEHWVPFRVEQGRLRVHGLRGMRTVLVWARDGENTWRDELEAGRAPERLVGQRVDLTAWLQRGIKVAVDAYDPWTGEWGAADENDGRVGLPEFSRSLVLRIRNAPRR
jgi:hypothetical protein